MGPISS